MIKKITTQAFLSAMLVMSVITATHAKEPEFKSELFKKGTLVYSDDFDGGNGGKRGQGANIDRISRRLLISLHAT